MLKLAESALGDLVARFPVEFKTHITFPGSKVTEDFCTCNQFDDNRVCRHTNAMRFHRRLKKYLGVV